MDLIKKIDEIRQEFGIDSLEYEWGGDLWRVTGRVFTGKKITITAEDFTVKLFAEFHNQLHEAFRKPAKEKRIAQLASVFKLIICDWGGIKGIKASTFRKYAENLITLPDSCEDFESYFGKNISSWSKILAAWNPERFFIYDNRVALALQVLFFKEGKFFVIPTANSKKISMIENIIESQKQGKENNFSYTDYCKLLQKTGNGNHVEKQLFMLGGKLGKLTSDQQQKVVEKYFS